MWGTMSRNIKDILACSNDWTQLTHEEIELLLAHERDKAATRAVAEDRESARRADIAARTAANDAMLAEIRSLSETYTPPVLQVVQYG